MAVKAVVDGSLLGNSKGKTIGDQLETRKLREGET
jgi:hypothetical protein